MGGDPRSGPSGKGFCVCDNDRDPEQKGTSLVKRRRGRKRLRVTRGGRGLVNHAGARLLSDLADDVGLTGALSRALAPTKQRRRGHDRGRVLADLAVMVADGGTRISDVAVLRDQPKLFEGVASTPTAWRTLEAVDHAALERVAAAEHRPERRPGNEERIRGST